MTPFRMALVNLKRLAGNKMLLLLLMVAPLLVMAAFTAVISPVFFSGGLDSFEVAVFNGDSGALTGEIVRGLMENEKTRGLISARIVKSEAEGQTLIKSGAAAMVIIPPSFQNTLESGGQGTLALRLNPAKAAQGALLRDLLTEGVDMVNDAQGGVNALYGALISQGMPQERAGDAYNKTARAFLAAALDRGAVIRLEGELSPLGKLLPVEYYASAVLAVFLFLGAMTVAGLASDDLSNCVLDRHLSSGRGFSSFTMSRVLAGAILVFLQGAPAAVLMRFIASSAFSYSGSAMLAVPAMLVFSFAVSSGGVLAGTVMRSRGSATAAVFIAVAAAAVLGGAVIPASGLGALSFAAPYTPVGAAMRLFSNALFFFDAGEFTQAILVTAAYAAVFCAASLFAARRRA